MIIYSPPEDVQYNPRVERMVELHYIKRCLIYDSTLPSRITCGFVDSIRISPELKLATQGLPDVTIFEYSLSMTVRRL